MKNHFLAIADLQKKLLDINDENLESTQKYLINSPYVTSKRSLKVLLKCLHIISQIRVHSHSLIISLLSFLSRQIKSFFDSDDLFILFQDDLSLIYFLYEINLINIETIFIQSPRNIRCFLFFQTELQKLSPSMVQQFWTYCSDALLSFNIPDYLLYENISRITSENKEKHRQLCLQGRSDELITEIIRNDDINQFQSLVSKCNISLESTVKFSLYESNYLINRINSLPTLIEYAAFFASIQIFKFIYVRLLQLPDTIQSYAIAGGSYDIIHLLESKDVVFNELALSTAIEYHRNEIIDYLIDNYQPTVFISYQSVLLPSIVNYNLEILLTHIYTFDLNNTDDPYQWNALLCATASNHCDLIKFFYKKFNIQLDSKTSARNSAFHIAASKGFDDIIRFLCREKIIGMNETNETGETPLHIACKSGFLKTVKALVSRKGIDINARDRITNETPLISAAKHGNTKIVEFLIQQNNININIKDKNNRTFINYLPNKATQLMQLYHSSHK